MKRCSKGWHWSALGQKQTCALQNVMSALPPIATAKADIRNRPCLLYPKSGHVQCNGSCLLWANSGHPQLGRRVSSTGRDLLPARSRNKAPDLRPAFIVLVGPYDGQPELVWYSHQRVGRHLVPLAVKSYPIFSVFRIPIHILDALAISN